MDDAARQTVAALVERWRRLTPAQLRDDYNEANTRREFILPLFRALGWNTDSTEEVFEEKQAANGRVDYAFRIRGVSRFYLEAKALRVDLDSNPNFVKQAVTYAYSKGIPWVILTNFRELRAYNGDVNPRQFLTLTADQFVPQFDKLSWLSRAAVEQGQLEQEARQVGALPPRISIENRLYTQLREWREKLFNQLHQSRKDLSWPTVDETVQRLFNRLIFIRTCEDRRLEDSVLLPLVRQPPGRRAGSLLGRLQDEFKKFREIYDSELFNVHVLDELNRQDSRLDEALAEVIRGLYQPVGGQVDYDFSIIDADVLGRVYEQYLGYVAQAARQRQQEYQLRLEGGMPTDQAMEEVIEMVSRPQRRKAQGVYYTPRWVTDYIVKQTVGRFIAEYKNRPDAIANLRILDPACGSGSFLIRAYDELLRSHAQGRTTEEIFSDERLLLLRNNIYGVDLDPQAVEIARLNLLLRAVRERRLLPELHDNIKVGNSLIEGGAAQLEPYFGGQWRSKRPFNWEQEFPRIMADGGFDIIIGNPPYGALFQEPEADYLGSKYEVFRGVRDVYTCFIVTKYEPFEKRRSPVIHSPIWLGWRT